MGAKAEELLRRLPGYNVVTGHVTPSGGLVIYLAHRVTLDNAAAVYLPGRSVVLDGEDTGEDVDGRIAFHDDPSDEARLERLNTGGDW